MKIAEDIQAQQIARIVTRPSNLAGDRALEAEVGHVQPAGRVRLQRALYMPAMVGAMRHNPILKALYDRLRNPASQPKAR